MFFGAGFARKPRASGRLLWVHATLQRTAAVGAGQMPKKKAKPPLPVYTCRLCKVDCSGEASLLSHTLSHKHEMKARRRGVVDLVPNPEGLQPQPSEAFFEKLDAELNCSSAAAPIGSAGGRGAAGALNKSGGHDAKFYLTAFKCAACGSTISGPISFVEHCRGRAHAARAGHAGFAGLLPNDGGVTPPVPPELLADGAAGAWLASKDKLGVGELLAAPPPAPPAAPRPPMPPMALKLPPASLKALAKAHDAAAAEAAAAEAAAAEAAAADGAAAAAGTESDGDAARRRSQAPSRRSGGPGLVPPIVAGGPLASQRARLPIAAFRSELLAEIERGPVVVLQGDTGCGKTTQLPQFLLEEAADRGAALSIVCTQPRRISAMGVAERVANERGEPLGATVGYSIRLENKSSSATRLLFCTTGILLRRLEEDPTLQGTTHVVVDEVHERSVESDFLLMVLRPASADRAGPLLTIPGGARFSSGAARLVALRPPTRPPSDPHERHAGRSTVLRVRLEIAVYL